jgi:hypothetical protein
MKLTRPDEYKRKKKYQQIVLPGYRLIVKLDADQVRLGLRGFKVDPELGIALRLNVVGDVLSVDGYDDL